MRNKDIKGQMFLTNIKQIEYNINNTFIENDIFMLAISCCSTFTYLLYWIC